MTETGAAASALVREVIAASRAQPGEQTAALTALLAEASIPVAEIEEMLAAVKEEQQSTARLRRRTVELEALFSTARELVRLQDVTDVLRRLVERAHELMGTDVTYLSEVDNDRGDLRVRYSAGTVTSEFRDLMVPAGFGLASLVAESREPVWVRQYERMADAPHDPAIDDAVAREGLVSFLGVPLAVGDEVLGVLFACNRFAHGFTPDQVLLLSAFADHAAAVLHSARVLAESAAARAQAEAAYRELERNVAATQVVSGIHEELAAAVVSGATVIDLVSTVSDRLGRRVRTVDDAGRPLDAGAETRAGLPRRRPLIDAIRASRISGHATELSDEGRGWIVVAILGADRVLGAMVVEEAGASDDLARPTLERAAHVAALVSLQRDAVSAIRAERRARALTAVLDGADLTALDAEVSWSVSGVSVIDLPGHDGVLVAVADAVGDAGIVALRDGRPVIAWGVSDVGQQAERVRGALADRLRISDSTAVVGAPFDDAPGLRASAERALRDLDLLLPLGVNGTTVPSDELAPYHALTSGQPASAQRFIDGLLGPALSWDARRGTALVETLGAYFAAGETRQAAATALGVHPNTVHQRLDRVWSLLEGDQGDHEYRFRVQAAVRLEMLRRRLRARD